MNRRLYTDGAARGNPGPAAAGPYENRIQVLRVYLRGDAGLVVTEKTGRNRFRVSNRELVTCLLGREGGQWRLVGYFINDIANPT
jgi:hypothetical protein